MFSRLIAFIICIFIGITSSAFAQERVLPKSSDQVQLSFAPLVKQVAPAVVNIYTKRTVTQRVSPFMGDPFFDRFFGRGFGRGFGSGGGLSRQRVESALGSGVIIQEDGLVVTNAHVIKDAEEITVILPDGRELEAQKALVDERSDLALLRADHKGEKLPFAPLKPSESLEVGDLVLAIGNPFGVGQTVTSGIVSALARSTLNINDFNFFIQTDAAINPGNSGGALVSLDGGVIGINTAIYSRDGGSLGIGFAIPSEMVATVIAAEKMGRMGEEGVIRPWLGVTAQKVTADIAESIGLSRPAGVLMAALHKASPLRKAGVKVGDVVLSVNGKTVRDPAEMKFRMATVPIGDRANVTVLRNGKELGYRVKAIAPPDDPPREDTALNGRHPFSGATVANVNPAVATELGIKDEEGVVVVSLQPRAQATRFAREGDLILSVNGEEIEDIDDLEDALERPDTYGWEIILSRNGQTRQIVLR